MNPHLGTPVKDVVPEVTTTMIEDLTTCKFCKKKFLPYYQKLAHPKQYCNECCREMDHVRTKVDEISERLDKVYYAPGMPGCLEEMEQCMAEYLTDNNNQTIHVGV